MISGSDWRKQCKRSTHSCHLQLLLTFFATSWSLFVFFFMTIIVDLSSEYRPPVLTLCRGAVQLQQLQQRSAAAGGDGDWRRSVPFWFAWRGAAWRRKIGGMRHASQSLPGRSRLHLPSDQYLPSLASSFFSMNEKKRYFNIHLIPRKRIRSSKFPSNRSSGCHTNARSLLLRE